jgi:hypothetical protein
LAGNSSAWRLCLYSLSLRYKVVFPSPTIRAAAILWRKICKIARRFKWVEPQYFVSR